MKRLSILSTLLLSVAAACGGGDKPVQEPAPAAGGETAENNPPPAENTPPPAENTPPPAENTPPPEPPKPEPKTLSEDLDGDGTPETVTLAGTELAIGDVKVSLAGIGENAAQAELKTIDLNKKDKSKELVVVTPGAEGTSTWWIVTYDGKKKTADEPVEVAVAAEPTIKGNSQLVIVTEKCGEKTTTTWKMSKGKLTKGKDKKKGKYDEKKCEGGAGAAGR